MKKNGKLFGVISIVDILVILAVIFMCVSIYFRVTDSDKKLVSQSQTINYTFLIKDVRINTVDALSKGGAITDATTKEYMGEIDHIEYEPAIYHLGLENGEVIETEYPERYNVKVYVSVDGKENEKGYYTTDNKYLSVGTTATIVSKYVSTSGEISEIGS